MTPAIMDVPFSLGGRKEETEGALKHCWGPVRLLLEGEPTPGPRSGIRHPEKPPLSVGSALVSSRFCGGGFPMKDSGDVTGN